jgi:lia operon protein LiaG
MMGKTRLARVIIVTAFIAVAAFVVAALLGLATTGFQPRQLVRAGGTTIDERTSLPTGGVAEISVASVNEDVRIVEGTGESIEAWLHGTSQTRRPDSLPHLHAESKGDTAVVAIDRPPLAIGIFWSRLALDVTVPKGYAGRLTVGTVSANIAVADHSYGGVVLSTKSGDVAVGAVRTADFAMHTTSGRLRATGVVSRVTDISSVSGDVQLTSFSGDATVASTSADVDVGYADTPAAFAARSTSGTVTVRLPVDAQFALDARSTTGDIACKFPITVAAGAGSHALVGTVGTGAGKLSVRTVSGDIRIER